MNSSWLLLLFGWSEDLGASGAGFAEEFQVFRPGSDNSQVYVSGTVSFEAFVPGPDRMDARP